MATSRQLAMAIAKIMKDKKATEVRVLDLKKLNFITDYFVLCTADNERQSRAIVDEIRNRMEEGGTRQLGIEGYQDARWLLADYGDVVAHVFLKGAREFYNLDDLWQDATVVRGKR
jgi:ribosome-associated protein